MYMKLDRQTGILQIMFQVVESENWEKSFISECGTDLSGMTEILYGVFVIICVVGCQLWLRCVMCSVFETSLPRELPIVREITTVLREWHHLWKELYLVSTEQFHVPVIYCLFAYLPYLTLSPGWAGYYTCPAPRPYQFGPTRNPDVTKGHSNRLWSWKFTSHLALVTCSMVVLIIWSALSKLLSFRLQIVRVLGA